MDHKCKFCGIEERHCWGVCRNCEKKRRPQTTYNGSRPMALTATEESECFLEIRTSGGGVARRFMKRKY